MRGRNETRTVLECLLERGTLLQAGADDAHATQLCDECVARVHRLHHVGAVEVIDAVGAQRALLRVGDGARGGIHLRTEVL